MVSEKVIDNIREHSINGISFLKSNENDLREVASSLSDRVKIHQITPSTECTNLQMMTAG